MINNFDSVMDEESFDVFLLSIRKKLKKKLKIVNPDPRSTPDEIIVEGV